MLRLKNISKTYSTKDGVTHRALNNISLDFEEKGLVFILGKSGSGKSTLLNIIGGLDSFDRGEIYLYNKKFSEFKSMDYDFYRNTFTGFVFQEFNLINELTIEENVALSLDLQSKKDKERIDKIFEDLEINGLKDRKVFELSGGQKQRVAIARALVKNPSLILADEPTGSLDTNTTQDIINLLIKLSKERLVIVITHNRELAEKYGDRIIELKDGEVLKDLSLENNDEEEHASLIASSILKVPPRAKIRKEDIDKLNEVLNHDNIDHYISFETNQNKVKSMFPHLKEAINTSNIEKEKFKQYTYKEEKDKDVKLIKSKLPFKRGLRFGLSNLKVKIPKLIFTLILATLATTLSGIVDNFANYDEYKAITNTIKKERMNFVKIQSAYSAYIDNGIGIVSSSKYYLKEKDIIKINEINKEEAPLIYEKEVGISNYLLDWTYVPMGSISGFIEVDDIESYGHELLAKSNNSQNGVIISELIAREIALVSDFKDVKDVIDEPIKFDGLEYIISGIYKCDELEKYDILRTGALNMPELEIEYNDIFNNSWSYVYVSKGFVNDYKERISESREFDLDIKSNMGYNFNFTHLILKNENSNFVTLNSNDGVYVSQGLLDNYMESFGFNDYQELVDNLNDNGLSFSINLNGIICYISDSMCIKGYIESEKDTNKVVLDENLFSVVKDFTLNATGALIDVSNLSNAKLFNLVKTIYENGFIVNESFANDYSTLVEVFMLLESLLSGINNVVFVLAIILLFSFMLGSIKNNTRQIGILRAIGANVIDVIKIYVIEALIIGCISLVLSLLIYGIGGVIVNNSLTGYLSIFTFGFNTVLKMVLSTLLVVCASLIIPIIKICRMHPVDAIRDDK